MSLKKIIGYILAGVSFMAITTVRLLKKSANRTTYKVEILEPVLARKINFYEKYIKRILDVVFALGVLVFASPILAVVALLVKSKLGSPVLFAQERPGLVGEDGRETIFKMYKFRSMTNETDANGELLPDEIRLTKFGAWLRNTSLDELPEVLNLLNGTMSVIGPRPQLVRDLAFMTSEQRMRHTAKPGLSGLAQVNGRNAITWEEKLNWDLQYIEKVSLCEDFRIVIETVKKALIKQEGITQGGMATAEDFGDYLLHSGKIEKDEYDAKQELARSITTIRDNNEKVTGLVSIVMPSYNTAQYIGNTIQSVLNQTYRNWELIIVDDCSTDNTEKVLAEISDDRIRLLKNSTNSGAAVSRNNALREARGQWIAFLDSDDLWMPQKLEKQIHFMESNGYAFSYTNYREINVDNELTGVSVSGPKVITKAGMFNYCWPGCLTVMYDASEIGLVQIADIKKNNDYAMWLKVCRKSNCYLLDECLAEYRRGRAGSVSTHSIKTMIGWHYKLFREAEGMGVIESLFCTGRNLIFGLYKKKRYVRRSF